jgi:hypothetical protein
MEDAMVVSSAQQPRVLSYGNVDRWKQKPDLDAGLSLRLTPEKKN